MQEFGSSIKMASVYEFVDRLYCCNALSWSKDFRLALCTESRVRILSLHPEPFNTDERINLRQSYIPAEQKMLDIPKYDHSQNIQLLDNLSRDELNNLISDKIMNPFKCMQETLPFTGYCAVAWSLQGADKMGRCILATVSLDYRLMLFSQGETEYKWNKIVDLTLMRRKETFPGPSIKTPTKYQVYKKWCYGQAITAISWCPLTFKDDEDGSQYTILAAGSHLGTIVFWKIKLPCLDQSDCTILKTYSDHSNRVLCMAWSEYSGILAVAHYQGDLVCHYCKIPVVDSWTNIDTSENMCDVSCMAFCKTDKKNEDILIACKESYLYGYHIKVTDDNSVCLLSTTFVYSIAEMYATGITPLQNQSCLIAHHDGKLETVKPSLQSSGLQLEVKRYDQSSENENSMRCVGMSVSTNEALIACVKIPPPDHDHLSNQWKNPTKVILRRFDGLTREDIYTRLTNYKGLQPEVTDLMECYRQFLLLDSTIVQPTSTNMTKKELICKRFALSSKIASVKNKNAHKMKTEEDKSNGESSEDDVKYLNTCYRLLAIYIEQCVKCASNQDSLSESDYNILHHYLQFIEESSSMLSETVNYDELKTSISGVLKGNNTPAILNCPVCNTCLKLVKLSWQCENGHQFGLCCHTLKPCIEMDYRNCLSCSALSLSVDKLKDHPWFQDIQSCVFCECLLL